MSFSELTAKLKFLLGICRWPLRTPTPLLYCLFCGPYRSHLIHFLTNIIFAITIYVVLSFYASTLYLFNFSTANLLLNSYSKMCDTIIMFNLIIANLDVKMRLRPAANPHQQEKKTRKYYVYVMFQFAGNIIKNDAKNTDLFPH